MLQRIIYKHSCKLRSSDFSDCNNYGEYIVNTLMSTFGTLFRVTTYGESHCPSVGCIVDGIPPVSCFLLGMDFRPNVLPTLGPCVV